VVVISQDSLPAKDRYLSQKLPGSVMTGSQTCDCVVVVVVVVVAAVNYIKSHYTDKSYLKWPNINRLRPIRVSGPRYSLIPLVSVGIGNR